MPISTALAAADSASAAFPAWSALGPNARRKLLNAAADALERRTDEAVARMATETGAAEGWAQFNVQLAVGIIRESAAMTTQIGGEVIPSDKPGLLALALREPVGVILGIAPWNAPLILAARAVAMPLACGNTVLLKASERCPRSHAMIAEAFADTGLPDGVLNLVTNAPEHAAEVVGALIDHPAVKRINFTGSTAVGRIVARRAAEQLKPVLLELGGKAPLIVLADADLDEAAAAAAFGAFLNAGQICMSTERIIVVAAIADAFAERFAAKANSLAGAPFGAMIDDAASDHVRGLIDDALAKGARTLASEPTVLDGITADMALYRDESFGPLVGIIRAADEEDAIRIANDSDFGLAAAVFTRDIARGLQVARRIRSGICHINGPTVADEPQMPFGGVAASGYGRFGGKAGIDAFTELRWITIAGEPGHYPF
ncbi:MAG: aldehyde dehydrogenase [Sphingomicrobium sp.]